ncbi:uncharacterized protein LOC111017093, partial [Momordica charantia]|uniref:Uncharacterized protein LOC111017093 n=1 Tax=Momordica charantia TaxID=3673 RepID=A0A6J1D419_MOMCH
MLNLKNNLVLLLIIQRAELRYEVALHLLFISFILVLPPHSDISFSQSSPLIHFPPLSFSILLHCSKFLQISLHHLLQWRRYLTDLSFISSLFSFLSSLMIMAPTAGSFSTKFLALLLLIVHVGCFLLTSADHRRRHRNQPSKKRRVSPVSSPAPAPTPSCLKPHKALSSSISFLKRIFSSKTCKMAIETTRPSTPARSSQHSIVTLIQPEIQIPIPPSETPNKSPSGGASQDSDMITAENQFFPLRNDIFPCTACGEIFPRPQLLEQHQSAKHAVSELADSDSGKNIVRIIFETGWTSREKSPKIVRILKIHNSQKILSRFEEYRESVKAKAARNGGVKRRDE